MSASEKLKVDSLKKAIDSAPNDSVKVAALVNLDAIIYHYDYELDEELNLEIASICKSNLAKKPSSFFDKELSNASTILGNIEADKGNLARASNYYYQSMEILERLSDRNGLSAAYINLGMLHNDQKEYRAALSYYFKALANRDSIANPSTIGNCLNNIGVAYDGLKMIDSSLYYHKLTYKYRDSIGDYANAVGSLNNLASIYLIKNDLDTALSYYLKAYERNIELNNLPWQSINLTNIGLVYMEKHNFQKAIEYANKAIAISEQTENKINLRDAQSLAYSAYKEIGDYAKALMNFEAFISTRDSIMSEENQKELIRQQYAYEYEKQAAEDSVKSAEEAKVKDAQLAAEQAENKQHKLEAKQQEQQKYFLFGGLGLALLFGGFIFNRFRVTSKQKGIIEEQKQKVDEAYGELEEKNTEILDSINYAKRIQSAILPPSKLVKEYLSNSFVLYKPKDIVAGDFYWMEVVKESGNSTPSNSPKGGEPELPVDPKPLSKDIEEFDNTILFAAADCTGHGVPGAMVSVVCNNGLNRSVREHGLIEPGQILDKTREIVISEFEKSVEEVKDGMDIALCSLSFAMSRKQKQSGSGNQIEKQNVSDSLDSIQSETQAHSASAEATGDTQTVSDYSAMLKYAGAHNPLWIIRKTVSAETGESFALEEVKAEKQPIGKYDEPLPYTTHKIKLNGGDSFYIFSDGYADQFGGEKGKKFKAANFKRLLLSIQSESMERQRELIDEAFEKWKGELEQLDDVCVIGVRV